MSDPRSSAEAVAAVEPGTRSTLFRAVTHSSGWIGLAILIILVCGAIVVPLAMPGAASTVSFQDALRPPSFTHWFGTDQLGRDVLARVFTAGRTSMSIGLAATCVGVLIGVPLGAFSGYVGGRWDFAIQRVTDALLALPSLLLALALIAGLGTGVANVITAVGIAFVPAFVRVARGSTLSIRESGFVEAARALGVPTRTILRKHILPHLYPIVIVQSTTQLGGAILTAASLGFLGLGIAPSIPEWGSMAAEARDLIFSHPRLVAVPGIAISLSVLAFNLLGDGLRDALDPRLKDI